MEIIIVTIFAVIGLIAVAVHVLYGIEYAIRAAKAYNNRPRPDRKIPGHWKINANRKIVDRNYVYVVRDDGAYIRVDREFGFLTFVWEIQNVGAFVSHWDKNKQVEDLTMKGNWYEAMETADEWFPMGIIVTEDHMKEFWIAHNKERRAEVNA